MPRVMIAPAPLANLPGEHLNVLKRAGFELKYPLVARQMVEDEVLAQMPGVVASVSGSEPYTAKVFAALPDLKVVARVGVGYDAVDVQAATDHGVVVTIAAGTNQEAVAEHCFMLMLALAKNLMGQHQPIKDGKWPRNANLPLRGKTLAIVGLGRIGKAVTTRAIAFGMKVVAYEPYPDRAFADKHGVRLLTLEDALKAGDYVSLHLPVTDASKHLIDAKMLALMKPTAFLVNTARGGVVDQAALYEWLRDKKIAGAGLDVFEPEPPVGNPLIALDNVVLTAHTAGVDLQSRDDMALSAATSIARLAAGEWPADCVVNPEVRGRFRWKPFGPGE